jgi:putative membrane protein
MRDSKAVAPLPLLALGLAIACTKAPSSAPSTTPAADRASQVTAPVGQALSDAQIARVDETLNSTEVDQATLAASKAKNAQVKRFAQNLLVDHKRAIEEDAALARSIGNAPNDSGLAEELASTGRQTLHRLERADAAAFDKLYVDGQVQQHQEMLDLLENHLIPRATAPQLKSQLEKARSMVDGHLTAAKELQQTLGNEPG